MGMVSVIVPAFNEENGIREVLAEISDVMEGSKHPYEVIVVDDGSTDKTSMILKELEVRVITHEGNQGYGSALKSGIRESKGKLIVILDADGSYPAKEIPRLIEESREFDMVVGARSDLDSRIESIRRLGRWVLKKLANLLVNSRIPDLNSGMRIFRKDIAVGYFYLLPQNFSFTTTLTLAMLSDNFKVKYIPVNYQLRKGKSKIRPIRDMSNFLLLIIRTTVYFNPLKVFFPIGIFLFLMGLIILICRVIFYADIGQIEILSVLLGVQIMMMGFVADLIVRSIKNLSNNNKID